MKRLGLRGQLAAGVGLLLALMLGIALLALWQGDRLGAQLARIVTVDNPRSDLARELHAGLFERARVRSGDIEQRAGRCGVGGHALFCGAPAALPQ